MAKALRIAGTVWCWGVGLIIAASLLTIWYKAGLWDGFSKVSDMLSPFNLANFIVTLVALAPGLLLLWGAGKVEARA